MIDITEQQPKEDETSFNTYEIDEQIFKNGEYVKKELNKPEVVKNKFKLLPGLTQEEIKQKDVNDDFLKYFAKISTKTFEYIGILSSQLKREKYGYSLMDNKDQFLGEYKNEIRDGFGIYKFYSNEEEKEEKDYYIGEYKNNSKTGFGLYLKIFKSIKDESSKNEKLINFSCGIGEFQEDLFRTGKIFSVDYENETVYKGKINEIGVPSDDEAVIVQGDKIFMGKLIDGELVEGRNIFVNEKGEKEKAYYFTKNENKDEPYNFDVNKNEEKDGAIIDNVEKSNVKNYKDQIQIIFDDVNDAMKKFSNYDTAIKVDFEKEIKNKIKSKVDAIINDLK